MSKGPLLLLAFFSLQTKALGLPAELSLSPGQVRELEKGEVVVQLLPTFRSTMKDVLTVGYVAAPLEEVWRVITDYQNYPRMFPGILKSEVRWKEGDDERHYSLLDYPWPFQDKWTINELHHDRGNRKILFHRIEGTVKELDGSWRLFPEGERTLVAYSIRLDPGVPFLPAWLLEWGNSRIAPQTIRNLRRFTRAKDR
ncbi:MAG TPA: hypothetical protein DD435_15765 [Cyanobacteria bacterium UBA8530]|nr:hypothetical protein [Cyanobacteria bacterium UBA8530]